MIFIFDPFEDTEDFYGESIEFIGGIMILLRGEVFTLLMSDFCWTGNSEFSKKFTYVSRSLSCFLEGDILL